MSNRSGHRVRCGFFIDKVFIEPDFHYGTEQIKMACVTKKALVTNEHAYATHIFTTFSAHQPVDRH
jgi:hypothetical protein